jgi:hypothetical protein
VKNRLESYAYRPPEPVTLAPECLPLNDRNLPWDRFEAFCRDLISRLPGTIRCYHYGKQGSKQFGIDLVAERADGQRWVYQCKKYLTYNEKQMQKAINDTTYKADKYHILVSCEVGTPVRDVCEAAGWEIWDQRDISQKVRELDIPVARRVIEGHFGAVWRKAFLRLDGPGTFVSAEEFFRPWLGSSTLFNHIWSLVGRSEELAHLDRFMSSMDLRAVVLEGRGGIGKSRLLLEFAGRCRMEHSEFEVLFLGDIGAAMTPAALDELPGGQCVVVIDDAHRCEDLTLLLAFARRRSSPMKIVLAFRPYGMAPLLSTLRSVGYDVREIDQAGAVAPLKPEDRVRLAREALGKEYAHLAKRLATVTADCPLVTVVAGRLLAQRQVPPALLESDTEFRYTVLNRFEDAIMGQVADPEDRSTCRQVLSLISAVTPFRDQNGTYIAAAGEFLKLDPVELRRLLGVYQRHGVLVRRGYTLRIVPDVLSDHILCRSCLTEQEVPTGYAVQVMQTFGSICPAEVLRNLAELDWRMGQSRGGETGLLNEVWRDIERDFRRSPDSVRATILGPLNDVALFQPGRVLALIEIAMRGPANVPERPEWPSGLGPAYKSVLHKIPRLLQRIAYTPKYLPYSCDLLWRMGRDDDRELNPAPEHPIRLLQDLAGYDKFKPISVTVAVVEAATRWLAAPDVYDHRYSPLNVLGPALQRSGIHSGSQGYQWTMEPFLVNQQNTQGVRKQVIDLIAQCARSGNVKTALKAVESLQNAMGGPEPLLTMTIPAEIYAEWIPEQLDILDILKQIVAQTDEPLVRLKVAEALSWQVRWGSRPAIRDRAREILDETVQSLAYRLTHALLGSDDDNWVPDDNQDIHIAYEQHQVERKAQMETLVQAFREAYPDVESSLNILNERLRAINAGGRNSTGQFFSILTSGNPSYAYGMCRAIIATPDMPMADWLALFLAPLWSSKADDALALSRQALDTGHAVLCRSTVHSLRFIDWVIVPRESEIILLGELLAHPDRLVKLAAIDILRSVGRTYLSEAVAMALTFEFEANTNLADEWCQVFDERWGVGIEVLEDNQLRVVLDKLVPVPEIGGYHISTFLKSVCKRLPNDMLNLLFQRIDHKEETDGWRYEPVPRMGFRGSLPWAIDGPDFENHLRSIRDRTLDAQWPKSEHLRELYKLRSQNFSSASLPVLAEWVDSGEGVKVQAVGRLLAKSSHGFIFANDAFVSNLLRQAFAASEECYDSVVANLFGSAISGMRSGTAGQPFPEDIQMRDQARQISDQLPTGSPEYRFYLGIAATAERSIADQIARSEEQEE